MIRKAYIIGVLAIGLAAAAAGASPVVSRLVCSARTFHSYFHQLAASGNSLSTVERFVFSFVLANTRASACTPAVTAAAHRDT